MILSYFNGKLFILLIIVLICRKIIQQQQCQKYRPAANQERTAALLLLSQGIHYFWSAKISTTGYETFLTFFPSMSRCQSVAIELSPRYWPGYLPCWDGPLSVRAKEGRGESMDGLMDGGVGKVERWRSPRERESGGSWRGPLGPLNWHVQAPGLSRREPFNKTCDNIQRSSIQEDVK